MITHTSEYPNRGVRANKATVSVPSALIEYSYYVYLVYIVMGGAFGLGGGNLAYGMLAILFGLCLLDLRSRFLTVVGLAAFPLCCGVTYVFIQLVFHGESVMEEHVQPFVGWMFTLVVLQSLSLRERFLHRFALITLLLGIGFLPFIEVSTHAGAYQRIAMSKGIAYSHTNSMAAWYGFCAVYFTVLGYTAKTQALRILTFLIALGCVYMVTLTVSRGALFAIAIAIVIASRHLLKTGFLPMLLMASVGWIAVALGIFDEAIGFYGSRVTEETGRFLVWPLMVERILDSPIIGVGVSDIGIVVSEGNFITPHNGFLFVTVASGIITGGLFVAYWLRAAWAALRANYKTSPDAVFYLPLVVYAFLIVSSGNLDFMVPWAIVSLASPMAVSVIPRQRTEPVRVERRTGLVLQREA